MVAFVPQVQMPDGGWTFETKLPLDAVPAWLTSPGLPWTMDRQFGTMAVTTPLPPSPVERIADSTPRGAPSTPAVRTPTPLAPNRAGAFVVRGTTTVQDLPTFLAATSTQPDFAGVFPDPPIVSDADAESCPIPPTGNADEVVNQTLLTTTKNPQDVLLAIVDGGFSFQDISAVAPGVKFDQSLSFSPPGGSLGAAGSCDPICDANGNCAPGCDEHANMCAYDATLIASTATLVDLRTNNPIDQRLSDAEAALNTLFAKLTSDRNLKKKYRGLVISNSWGLESPDTNLSPPYASNPNHPFTMLVKKLVAEGADVVFSAGDSAICPPASPPKGTIWGANSLDVVISVGAVDLDKARIVYSSEGPGALATNKPDVSSYSHFVGSDDGDQDTGTSASAAVVAGVVAAIRAQQGWDWNGKTPAQVKQRLIATADRVVQQNGATLTLTGWNRDFGFGVARVK